MPDHLLYEPANILTGALVALAFMALVKIRVFAVALTLGTLAALAWALLLAPGGPVAVADYAADRLEDSVRSGFWIGLTGAASAVHIVETALRSALGGRRQRRKR